MTVSRALARLTEACCDGHQVSLKMRQGKFLCEVTDNQRNLMAIEIATDIDMAISGAIEMLTTYQQRYDARGGEESEPEPYA